MKRLAASLASLATLLVLLAALVAAASAGNKKAEKFYEQGREAESRSQYDQALDFYEKAAAADPKDSAYQLAIRRVRFQASQLHVDRGQKLRKEGKLEEALKEFQMAFAIDPASTIAEQELRRTSGMLDAEKRRKEDPTAKEPAPEDRGLTPAELARRESEKRVASILPMPELKPISKQVTSLKIVNQPAKVLYETVGKLAGVNVLFDAEYQDPQNRKYSIDLSNTNLDESLDYVALLTKTFWKALSANTIFVTNDNVTKRRDYEEHVTRIFYMSNLTSPQELQEVLTAMRAVTDVRKVFAVNSQSAIVVRGTVDQIALAEKVLLDLDKPKAEVVVDVIVMEANRKKTRDLALTPISGGNPGLIAGIAFTPRGETSIGGGGGGSGSGGGSSGSGLIRLGSIADLNANDWSVTLPGYLLKAVMQDSQTRVVTTPQVRATDGQKATLRLGDRYPYATGSFQPGVGAVGVSPLVSTQFQFADIGVNVDVTPRIHGAEEVSMQVELEISTIRDKVNVGGLEQPVIGQRKVSHIVRVKEGEVTLIGGLMQGLQTKTRAGVPGLMQIPGIGHLFQSNSTEVNNSDLLVALIPHVVRAPDIQPYNIRTIASGTDQIFKLNYAPRPEEAKKPEAKPVAPAPAKPAGPGLTALPATLPPAAPAEAKPAETKPPAEAPAAQPPEGPPPPLVNPPIPGASPAAAAGPVLELKPSATEVPLNSTVTVTVDISNVAELFQAPMRIAFDNKVLRLIEVARGPFLSSDGQQVTFSETKLPDAGGAIITLNRVPGAGGVSGSGTLITLRFQAVGKGASAITFDELTLRDAKLNSIQVAPPSTTLTVK